MVALCKKKSQVRSESPTSLDNYKADLKEDGLRGLNELNIGKNSVQKETEDMQWKDLFVVKLFHKAEDEQGNNEENRVEEAD